MWDCTGATGVLDLSNSFTNSKILVCTENVREGRYGQCLTGVGGALFLNQPISSWTPEACPPGARFPSSSILITSGTVLRSGVAMRRADDGAMRCQGSLKNLCYLKHNSVRKLRVFQEAAGENPRKLSSTRETTQRVRISFWKARGENKENSKKFKHGIREIAMRLKVLIKVFWGKRK